MGRVAWMAVLTLGLLGAGVVLRLRRPSGDPGLPCRPEAVRVDGRGVAFCPSAGEGDAGVPLAAGALLGLGGRLDLNRASEAELALLPGVGPGLARALVGKTVGDSVEVTIDAFPDTTFEGRVTKISNSAILTAASRESSPASTSRRKCTR